MTGVDVLVDGDLTVRPMVDDDFATMAGWLSDPRVLSWFGGRDRPMSLLDITAKYTPRLAGTVPVHCLIAEYHGMPVGYLQYYRWRDFTADAAALRLSTLDNPYGMDLFIGRPELWGAGLGSRMLRLVLDHLFGTLGARRVALSAMSHNYRAQRAYQKVGFRRVRLVPDAEVHEGVARDEWLMVADRNSYTHRDAADATP
ncbi:hypothetical protein Athai_65000 [Actinocatenispora thailandica]|uniref:N-acetyltransferase domain-containing protein n=1 Tax=Actinocatenispora thailandica TaxID=227318 RepID=A0A7R7DW60_9ACTN|nr:GNAT family N-acetyltransferase [Actinocatenispora thailandica]BCJ38997.1 hypothetical protein Athai_65000 [Actinocatenispora thailandica]